MSRHNYCHDCTSRCEETSWPANCPIRGGTHAPGALMVRVDVFHQPSCPSLVDYESGVRTVSELCAQCAQAHGSPCSRCDEPPCSQCDPLLWFDLLPGRVIRYELRHGEDCHAGAAAEAAALVGVG